MYIGKLSKLTGASPKAIRHYEDIGLLPNVERSGSYRIYKDEHIVFITMIKRAQTLGFKLADIVPVVQAKYQNWRFPLKLSTQLIDKKRKEIQDQIAKAQTLDDELTKLSKELNLVFSDDT